MLNIGDRVINTRDIINIFASVSVPAGTVGEITWKGTITNRYNVQFKYHKIAYIKGSDLCLI